MNDIPYGYYRAENGMVKQKPEHDVLDSQVEPLDTATLSLLDKTALIALVQRIGAARWGEVAMMSKNERMEAARLKLWHYGLTQGDIYKALPALKEVMDREVGKAVTPIAAKIETIEAKQLSSPVEIARKIKFVLAMARDEERKRLEVLPIV